MARIKRRHPNVSSFIDRHGKMRWRWRKKGFPTYYFCSPPDTPGFAEELAQAEAGARITCGESRTIPRSVSDLCVRYYASTNFSGGGIADQRRRKAVIEKFRAEVGDDLVANFRWDHIEAVLNRKKIITTDARARKSGGPAAARTLRKQLMRLFAYAVRLGWISSNPVEQTDAVAVPKTGGFYTWTEDDIEQYRAHHALGTTPRLALEIMLWTAQRRGDARLFGPQHMRDGKINYTQGKTGTELWLPAAPQLLDAIRAMPKIGIKTYLISEFGKPFSDAGIGNRMREWCDAAGLPKCSAHGLRKATARRLAEMRATQQEIKATGGWKDDSLVATYTAAADQKTLAESAILRLSASELANRAAKLANSSAQGADK